MAKSIWRVPFTNTQSRYLLNTLKELNSKGSNIDYSACFTLRWDIYEHVIQEIYRKIDFYRLLYKSAVNHFYSQKYEFDFHRYLKEWFWILPNHKYSLYKLFGGKSYVMLSTLFGYEDEINSIFTELEVKGLPLAKSKIADKYALKMITKEYPHFPNIIPDNAVHLGIYFYAGGYRLISCFQIGYIVPEHIKHKLRLPQCNPENLLYGENYYLMTKSELETIVKELLPQQDSLPHEIRSAEISIKKFLRKVETFTPNTQFELSVTPSGITLKELSTSAQLKFADFEAVTFDWLFVDFPVENS